MREESLSWLCIWLKVCTGIEPLYFSILSKTGGGATSAKQQDTRQKAHVKIKRWLSLYHSKFLLFWTTFTNRFKWRLHEWYFHCSKVNAFTTVYVSCVNRAFSLISLNSGLLLLVHMVDSYANRIPNQWRQRNEQRNAKAKPYLKQDLISQGRENVLFLPSNMATMASHENALF